MAGGVYEGAEINLDGEIDITQTGIPSRIDQLKDQIDRNFMTIFNALENARLQGYQSYNQMKNEYEKISDMYAMLLEEVTIKANQSNDPHVQQAALDKLYEFLALTDDFRSKLEQGGFVSDESVEGEGIPATTMVTHNGNGNGNTIPMQNVGPMRAWWGGLRPGVKTLVAAGGIAAGIYGAKKLFGWVMDKYAGGE